MLLIRISLRDNREPLSWLIKATTNSAEARLKSGT
nr:MAG TPA: hypothetical protein [Caudoviricetes sp.]